MSREKSVSEPEPQYAWVVTVDSQNQVRLSKEAGLVIRWLAPGAEAFDCIATVGSIGGIRIGLTESLQPIGRLVRSNLKDLESESDAGPRWPLWPVTLRQAGRYESWWSQAGLALLYQKRPESLA